jgi:hypothetical protein
VAANPAPFFCDRCAVELHPGRGEHFVIRIEAVADPSPPTITEEDLQRDTAAEIDRLVEAMRELSEQEAMDQVYRKVVIHLCNPCYRQWIESPAAL